MKSYNSCEVEADKGRFIRWGRFLIILSCGWLLTNTETSAQTSNSLEFIIDDGRGSKVFQSASYGQADEEIIPFRLDEDLFGEGKTVHVSLRVFNILQHFVAVPKKYEDSERSDSEGDPVVDLEFNQPGIHYASWNKLDHSGNKVVPGVYFVQLTIESEVVGEGVSEREEISIPRRGGFRGFLNMISPGDPFKENVSDTLMMDTFNTVMRIVIS